MQPETLPLALGEPSLDPASIRLSAGAVLLRGFARLQAPDLLAALDEVRSISPLRHMETPGGWRMSVAMTNCGKAGWVSDPSGYRYDAIDPDSGKPWPGMPEVFSSLAREAADAAGFPNFRPDACLINQYAPGARLSLHQDRNERDFGAPIVSVSLGLPATFLWGGEKRADRAVRVPLIHGDIAVWGGLDRLRFHGVLALKDGIHPLTGAIRYNLTLRKAR
jgi:alkylated DNA repair protein (DNA oxidative demethylase)